MSDVVSERRKLSNEPIGVKFLALTLFMLTTITQGENIRISNL